MNPTSFRPLVALVFAVVLAAACQKDEPPPPPPAPADVGNKEVELKIDAQARQPIAPPKLNDKGLPDIDFIYQTTRRFLDEQKRPARDLEELIALGYMPKLPPPPPGKKYILNQRAAMIQIVDAPKK